MLEPFDRQHTALCSMDPERVIRRVENEQLAFVWGSGSELYFLWYNSSGGYEQSKFSIANSASRPGEVGRSRIRSKLDNAPCAVVVFSDELRERNVSRAAEITLPAPIDTIAVTEVPDRLRRIAEDYV